MSTAAATVVENLPKTGESAVEKPANSVEGLVESGDVSGVYNIAQHQVDAVVESGKKLSTIDDPNTATIAGPEVIALKQADAELESKTSKALGALKTDIGIESRPIEITAPTAEPIPAAKPKEEVVQEVPKPVEVAVAPEAIPAVPVTETESLEQPIRHFDEELQAEKRAMEDFLASHGSAHSPLEQAYLDALTFRIKALEFEKSVQDSGEQSYESQAKQVELNKKAEKAEQAYQAMYDAHETVSAGVADADEHENLLEQTFSSNQAFTPSPTVEPKAKPVYEASPMTQAPPKPKGAVGKFIDGLKFWKYLTKNPPQ